MHNHEHDHEYMHAHGIAHSHGHVHENQKAVINRLARAIGHLEKVKRMVEDGHDCSEVLVQLAAVRSGKIFTHSRRNGDALRQLRHAHNQRGRRSWLRYVAYRRL